MAHNNSRKPQRPSAYDDEDGTASSYSSGSYSDSYTESSYTRSGSDYTGDSGSYSGSFSGSGSSGSNSDGADSEIAEEPEEEKIKYRTFPISSLTANQQITVMLVREKFIFLATDQGMVNVLDINGDQLFQFNRHINLVKDLSCDADENYVASCCVGGTVNIQKLYMDAKDDFYARQFDYPLTSIALHPKYDSRNDKPFLAGGLDGAVTLVTKTWPFGNRTTTLLGKKEGKIHAIRWRGAFAAWANDTSIVLCNMDTKNIFHQIPRPQSSPRADMFRCNLWWESDTSLIIGWGNWVHICNIKEARFEDRLKGAKGLITNYRGEVGGGFETDRTGGPSAYRLCGLAPFGENELLLLSCTVKEEVQVQRLQMRIVDRISGSLKSLHEYKGRTSHLSLAYSLCSYPLGNDTLYYIVSPDLVIVAEPCNDDDKVEFLLQHKKYREAFKVGQTQPLQRYDVEKLGNFLLNHLVSHGHYEEAATRFREVLGATDAAEPKWREWINLFIHKGKTECLAPYLPYIENGALNGPRLQREMYECMLGCLLDSNTRLFKEYVMRFKYLYNYATVCHVTKEKHKRMKVERSKGNISEQELCTCGEALGLLYEYQDLHGEALTVLLDVKGGEELFDFIGRHKLYAKAADILPSLFNKNKIRTISLLLNHQAAVTDESDLDPLGPDAVIKKLIETNPLELWSYLEALREKDAIGYNQTARRHPQTFTLLYADYDRPHLLPFLKSILPSLNLRKTFEICKQKDLLEERVYIMARMGNRDEGLDVIVKEMKNIPKAIDYVRDFPDEDQKELYDRLFDLIFQAESKNSTFDYEVSEKGESMKDIVARFSVRRQDVVIKEVSRIMDVNEEIIELPPMTSLTELAEDVGEDQDTIVMFPPSKVAVTPHMLSQLLRLISDPHIGETSVIDAAKLVRRITNEDRNIPDLGPSLSAITYSKGAHRALMATLLRVLEGDVADLHKTYGKQRSRAIRVHPTLDRMCSTCSSMVDKGGLVIFACHHASHASCLLDEIQNDETQSKSWLQQPPADHDKFFRQPHAYLREKARKPCVWCRECPQIEEASGI